MLKASEPVELWWPQLYRLVQLLNQCGPDEVCCEGLTPRQTAILRTLVEQEGARLSDLAAAARISPSAMTRIIEKLEAQKLVERVRGAQVDGRAAMVRITPQGRKARRAVDELMRQWTAQVIASVPERQRDSVLEALNILNEAFQKAGVCASNLVQIGKRKES